MKSKEELLKQFKKANQAYKQKLIEKQGFKKIEDYLNFLLGKEPIKLKPKLVSSKTIKKLLPTIHIVDILDASGSMTGYLGNSKYDNSKEGILNSIQDLKKVKDIKYTYSLVEFIQKGLIKNHFHFSSLPEKIDFYGALGYNTPLYSTVYNTLLSLDVKKEDKVLVKIYTDGGNNTDPEYTILAKNLIKDLQKQNFTITFVATKEDMPKIIRDLNLDGSNTLAVENNAEGFKKAFKMSSTATMNYSASVTKGEDVSRGFYKKVGSL